MKIVFSVLEIMNTCWFKNTLDSDFGESIGDPLDD